MRSKILDSMARTLFACAWMDAVENAETRAELSDLYRHATSTRPPRSWTGDDIRRSLTMGPGGDWMIGAPATADRAHLAAASLALDIEAADGTTLEAACTRILGDDAHPRDVRDFGRCLVMESLGHGVAWSDEHDPHGLTVPHTEFCL
jgi:hypothetical protein